MLSSELDAKRLDLLVQAVPAAKIVAVLRADNPRFEPQLLGIGLKRIAPSLDLAARRRIPAIYFWGYHATASRCRRRCSSGPIR